MKIGIFGGSFDPVHFGHLIVAEQCREQAGLDQVWFVPAFHSPLKKDRPRASDRQRREMLELAIAGHESFRVSDIELQRNEISYTVDTLRQLGKNHPADDFHLIVGADSLATFPRWREPAEILQLATLIVFARPDATVDYSLLEPFASPSRVEQIKQLAVESLLVGISSTLIRDRIHEGRSVRYLMPRGVEKYLQTTGLYRPAENG